MSILKNQAKGIPFGMAYPLTFGGKTFQENFEYGRQIKDNVRHLLYTQKGEKDYDLEFGSDLTKLVFEYNIGDPQIEIEADRTIREAIETYLPNVVVTSLSVSESEIENAIKVSVDFSADFANPQNLNFTVMGDGTMTETNSNENARDNQYGD
tara:strand:- start:4670 stop:5128 length:459 start_codon:yes stop_codon:yes gene_type:complete